VNLVWKLLRRHVSLAQLAAFFLANLLGVFVVLLALQFYRDVKPLFTQGDGFLRSDYLIVNKRLSALDVLGGSAQTFSDAEIEELRSQSFCRSLGGFTASRYDVSCRLAVQGMPSFGTDMFFESVPDAFLDVDVRAWSFDEAHPVVPIILPRTYLALYNFGFARSKSLPQLSEGLVGSLGMQVALRGNGLDERFDARVVGFSTRLNTILVPESFMQWSNRRYAPQADAAPTRLIVEVQNPADDAIPRYMDAHGYELEDNKLEAGRTMFFLRVAAGLVLGVGLLISALAFYLLMLSIYLLVQKNADKLCNLLLIGYSPCRVAMPYQLLAVTLNAVVLLLAVIGLWAARRYYLNLLWTMFPRVEDGPLWPTVAVGAVLFLCVSAINVAAIRRRIQLIWKNKD